MPTSLLSLVAMILIIVIPASPQSIPASSIQQLKVLQGEWSRRCKAQPTA